MTTPTAAGCDRRRADLRPIRRRGAVLVVLTLVGLWGWRVPALSAASEAVSYTGTAEASGSRVTYQTPNYLSVPTPADVATLEAQAVGSSNGGGGFAALPYPGDLIITLPTTANGLGMSGLPAYPLYVESNASTPHASLADPSGSYGLDSETAEAKVSSSAQLTNGAGKSEAHSTVVNQPDGSVVATATSITTGIGVSGVLGIGTVRSVVTTTYHPGHEPVTTRDLTVEGASVAGNAVSIGPDGLSLPGSDSVGPPVGSVIDTLNASLAQNGISIRVVEGEDLTGGGTASVVQITVKQATPDALLALPLPVVGFPPQNNVTITLGSGFTTVLATSDETAAAAEEAFAGSTEAPLDISQPGANSGSGSVASGSTSGTELSTAQPASRTLGTTASLPFFAAALRLLYLVIVIGGALGLVASWYWRRSTEGASWTS